MRIHNGEKPFDCKLCGKFFTEKSSVKRHLRKMHFNQYNKKCTVCGIISKTREEHRDHLVTHKLKVYSCQVCHKDFIDSRALKVHTFNAHSSITQSMNLREYRCQQCDKQFFSTKGLKNHLKTHKIDFKMFSCKICKKLFITEQGLTAHMRDHVANKEHCEICNKQFSSEAYAAFHRKQHILEKLNAIMSDKEAREKQKLVKTGAEIKVKQEPMDVENSSENQANVNRENVDSAMTNSDLEEVQAAFTDYIIRLESFKNFSSFYFIKTKDAQDLDNSDVLVKGMLTDGIKNSALQTSDSDKKGRGFSMYRCNFCRTFKLRKREILRHHETVHFKKDNYNCSQCSAV